MAYSDGVIAIIVTIMVLDLHAPTSGDPRLLLKLWPVISTYALSSSSSQFIGSITTTSCRRIAGSARDVLWFNVLWLFCLSLFPFATAYSERAREEHPSAIALYWGARYRSWLGISASGHKP